MGCRVYITATGLISSIGLNKEENLESLIAQRSGIHKVRVLGTNDFVAGEIDLTNKQLAELSGFPEISILPRSGILAILAIKEIIEEAKISNDELFSTGLILGNTVGGMDLTEKYYSNPSADKTFIKSHSCGYITEQAADKFNMKGLVTTLSTACSSGANAIMVAARLIKNGLAERVIAGGTDALTNFTYNGFKSLMVMDSEICKPFDLKRKGMNLGEGAGLILLESEESLIKRKARPIAELTGYSNANDAYHPTATSPEATGPYMCMQKALKTAGLKPADIDFITVHGTGTENNDLTEMIALQKVFPNGIPPFSSCKSTFGHTLGAAGGIGAVVSVMSIRNQLIFPSLFFDELMDPGFQPPVTSLKTAKIQHVLANSFGFGGNCASLIFSGI